MFVFELEVHLLLSISSTSRSISLECIILHCLQYHQTCPICAANRWFFAFGLRGLGCSERVSRTDVVIYCVGYDYRFLPQFRLCTIVNRSAC